MKSKKKFVLAGLVLLAAIITGLTLISCETEVDPSTPQQEQTDGNTGNSDGGNTQQPGGDNSGNEDEVGGEKPVTYTVTFNANGGTGTMESQTFIEGMEQELSANQFKRDTWTFSGWSEDKAATTATYGDKAKFKATKNTTLYAVWTDNGTVSPVTFTPADGTKFYFDEPLSVTLATTEDGATIQYKLDDGKWQDYTVGTPISVTTSTTITAKATKAGLKDRETTASYTVRQLTAITVTPPTRTVYSVDDSFDNIGMKVTATYDDETSREVTESATTDFATVASGKGIGKPVTVSCKEGDTTQTATFTVDVASYKFTEEVEAYEYPSGQTGTASLQSKPAVSNPIYKKFGDWPQTVRAVGIDIGTRTLVRGGLTYHVGSDGNYYVKQGNSYYKVEPIVWRVLTDSNNGKSLLLAERILTGGIKWADSSNNYQNSNIRKWLNGNNGTAVASDYAGGSGFLQTAFTTSA